VMFISLTMLMVLWSYCMLVSCVLFGMLVSLCWYLEGRPRHCISICDGSSTKFWDTYTRRLKTQIPGWMYFRKHDYVGQHLPYLWNGSHTDVPCILGWRCHFVTEASYECLLRSSPINSSRPMKHSKHLFGHAAAVMSELDSTILYQLWVYMIRSGTWSSAAYIFLRH
jgi:hypothetical protein